jgi:uncharacterized protein YggU (UPF0235/DUF167 family)
MLIEVKVITKAYKNSVEHNDGEKYTVRTTIVPEKGKANKMVQKLLSDYFNVAKSNINIIKGISSKNKIIDINIK